MINKLRQFRALNKKDRKLFVKIAFITPFLEICLRFLGFNRLLNLLHNRIEGKVFYLSHTEEVERHKKLVFLFYNNFPFAGRCLARSLTLWFLLKRKGINTDLRFGMRKEDGKLKAHAWVEHHGKPITIDPEVQNSYKMFAETITPTTTQV